MKPTVILTAALLCVLSPISNAKPIKVFILAGQSNMEGQGSVDHGGEEGKGNLVWSMKHSKSADKMKKLKNEKGEWVVRDDVQVSFKVGGDKILKGGLTVGYTGYAADGSRSHMGPELGFGFVLGDFYEEPVLLIKTAWGGHSLHGHFRSPSSGKPTYDTGTWPKPEDIGRVFTGSRAITTWSPRRRSPNMRSFSSIWSAISARNSMCRTCRWLWASWVMAGR